MEKSGNDGRMDVVEGVDSLSHVYKPYELGTGAENLESAVGTGGEEESVAATELFESSGGVCVEKDGTAVPEDMPVAGGGDGESALEEKRVAVEVSQIAVKPAVAAVEGGGEIIAARSDDLPRENKAEDVTESVDRGGGDAQVDELLVEPQLDMKAEQELSPKVDAKLEMVGGDAGVSGDARHVSICSDWLMDAGRDEKELEEEVAPVIDSKVGGGVVADVGDKKSYDFPMVVRDGELQVTMQEDARRGDMGNPHPAMKPVEEFVAVTDSVVDGEEEKSLDFPLDARAGELHAVMQKDARKGDSVNPQSTMKPEVELVAVINGKVDMVVTDVGDEEKSFDLPVDAREGELQEVAHVDARMDGSVTPQVAMKPEEKSVAVKADGKVDAIITDEGDEKKSCDLPMGVIEGELQAVRGGIESLVYKSERGVGDVESVKEVRRVDRKLVDSLGVENNTETLVSGAEVGEEKASVLANDLDVETAEILADAVEGKLDPMITGDIPIPAAKTNAEMTTEVNACVANVSEQEQVREYTGSTKCAGNAVICRNAEDKEMDNTMEDKDMSTDILKNSELDKPVNVDENFQERLEDAAVREEASAVDIKEETEMEVELDSKGMNMDLLENTKLYEYVNVEENLQERLEDAAVREEASGDITTETEVGLELDSVDMSMEFLNNSKLDEPVDVQESLEDVAVKEGTSAEDFKKDTKVGVECESKDIRMGLLNNSDLDEPVNVQENLEDAAVKEEASAGDMKKEIGEGVELDSARNVVTEEIQSTEAQAGTEMSIEVEVDKSREDDGTMEMEEAPSDMDEPGEDNYDSPAAPQDDEDEKMVANDKTLTQDTIMETEIDIPDSEKTTGGKRKRAKVTKSPVSKAMAKTSRKKVREDVCFICFDGGELVICDRRGCPKAYHPSCVNHDEAFFKSKGRWNCGWHLCSICEKNAHFMCYTCTFSLCKSCVKEASFLCVRGSKGFCKTCMRTVMLIENEQENQDTQVDFDDKNSWEYLFKDYYIALKAKLSLSPVEIAEAKNPCKGANMSGPSKQESLEVRADANDGGSCSDEPAQNLEPTRPKRRKVRKQSKSLAIEDESISTSVEASDKAIIIVDNSEWASKELLEFVLHMKDGDTSVLSQFDVQALLLDYIKRNKLRDPRRKSQIICDARLENLFGKPRVGHFEMLKLLESHFLVREEQNDEVQGSVVDAENNLVDTDANADPLTKDTKDRKRKYRKKGASRGPQSNLDDYAAIDMHNIGLIYLRRKLMEDLLEDTESFHEKVIGTFVRIRISGSASKQDLYRLVQVVGTNKVPEPYKVGKKTTDLMVEILNLDKTEIISIDTVSSQEFSEEECKRLRQSIKCGLISRLTVGEILDKTMELQAARVNDWLESETLRLNHLRDRASDLGRRKELRECVEKLQRLKTPDERQRRLEEIPEIHADPKMDPSYESDDHDSETEDSRQDAFMRSRSSSFCKRGRVPISPVADNSVKDSWTGAGKVSSKTWEPSTDLSSNNFSISSGHSGDIVFENSSTLGRDRGRHDSSNLSKMNSAASSEPAEWAPRYVARPESSSGVTSVISRASSSTGLRENFVKINESEKIWHYQDPSGKVQGPFSMVQLRKWNNTGYFPADLRIWRTTENQANAILLADALAGKIPTESPPTGNTPQATNILHGSHTLTGHSSKASGTFSHETPNTDQMSGSLPKLMTEKLLGNDLRSLPSPTPKQNNSGSTGLEGDILTGAIQSPSVNGVLSSPTPVRNNRTHSSAPASVLSSVLQAVVFSSIPNSQPGSMVASEVALPAQTTATIEQPPVVEMHSNLQATVHPVQNLQTNTHGWAAGAQTAQPQGHGWSSPNVQNSSGSFSTSGTPSRHQPDVWMSQSSQPNIHLPPTMPDVSWAMGSAGNNSSMGVRPDNPSIGWGSMPGNPNMGWVNPTTGNPNMNWGPAMQVPPARNTPGWVAPPGNTGPNVQGMVPANPNLVWAPAQNWGPPPVQGQVPGPGWGMPGGNAGGPALGNGWGLPSANAGGPPPAAQGPPQGSTNQGWVGPTGNQGVWNGEQNHMGGQFSGQRGGQGRDTGFNCGRPWNRQSSFGGGGGHRRKSEIICPYNANGRCRKGTLCDYLHT